LKSNKQRRFLGAVGILTKKPSRKEEDSIRKKYTNFNGEYPHKNPRTNKHERIPLEKIKKLNDRKFALIGTSPNDKLSVSRIVEHR